jgi:hypothetical protein
MIATHPSGYRSNVQQPKHHAVCKTRPAAQIALDSTACFKALAQDLVRLRHKRAQELYPA